MALLHTRCTPGLLIFPVLWVPVLLATVPPAAVGPAPVRLAIPVGSSSPPGGAVRAFLNRDAPEIKPLMIETVQLTAVDAVTQELLD